MEREFWLERWRNQQIGFHLEEVNPHLTSHWPQMHCPAPARVFVPLCGKSRDLLWLAAQGHKVLGVEISPLAVQAFFEDNQLQPRRRTEGPFEVWQCGEVSILLGDFFDLRSRHLAAVQVIYDRASLVALPPEMRARYVRHVRDIAPPQADILLITMEYPQQEMNGPPFAVSEQEVHRLYADGYNIQRLASHDIWAQTPRFREKGLTELYEKVYRLARA